MTDRFSESTVEQASLTWLLELGWQVRHETEIAPDGLFAEQRDFGQVVLDQRLRDALLPMLISGEIRVKDVERFLMERGL
jgi:hypothetical protein